MASNCAFIFSGCSSVKTSSLSIAGDKDASAIAEFMYNPEHFRLKDRKFEQVPAIGATADGKQVFVAWYSGGAAPGPGNYVTLSVSQDSGNTWLNDRLVIYPSNKSYRLFDPAIWRDNAGKVHLFYGSAKNNLIWDGFGGVNSVEIKWDGKKISTSKPLRISDGVMSNKPVYLSSKNLALFPVYIDKPLPGSKSDRVFPQNGVFIYSKEYSKSPNTLLLSPYASIKIDEDLRIHDEPQVVEISEVGECLAMLRTTKGIYYTKSSDFGKNWSAIQPFTASGPTTSSRFYLGKLSSGNLLLVSNNSTTRNKMTAFLSKDGGNTWPHKLLLDPRENVSYPDADQTSDGNIHVVFDRERTGAKDILYCRFTENDILSGNSSSVFKTRVNK
jgi:hypothetical protein